ncbi:S-layer homology domain-containing protein [Sporosarcina sp. SAFN-010]|uniref:S-layer homology domain-containing protein n=1 Tax=Sporosarcina sp. SAFN-010 TaxID=3387273 RepID=UPI003F81F904
MKKAIVLFLSVALILLGNVGSVKAEGFSDVHSKHPFAEHMRFLYDKGIIRGFENNRFAPDNDVTRGDAALMIARTLDLKTEKRDTVFSDVSNQSAASGAIQSASEAGIINGYTDGAFRPNAVVTRGQMASFLARAFKLEEEEALSFYDVPISSSSYSDIRKVITFGVTEGYSDGRFQPARSLTRAQFSAFLARALNDELRLTVYVCGYDPESRENPDRQTMNCLLTKAARQAETQIPPEIVKALVSVESNGWKQFTEKGEPIISNDGGIGLMQITNTTGYDVARLKYDLMYNIEAGLDFLRTNFDRKDLPKIADHNSAKLEHWYFAVMAYNGTKSVNSPFYQSTGERNPNAYQEKVYLELRKNGLLNTNINSIGMIKEDFSYGESTNHTIQFNKMIFDMTKAATTSKELLKTGDTVTYFGTGMRSNPNTSSKLLPTTSMDKLTILGAPVYNEPSNSKNQFVWYPAQTVKNGKNQSGFIASPYIN